MQRNNNNNPAPKNPNGRINTFGFSESAIGKRFNTRHPNLGGVNGFINE
jgi:hypothetical protein